LSVTLDTAEFAGWITSGYGQAHCRLLTVFVFREYIVLEPRQLRIDPLVMILNLELYVIGLFTAVVNDFALLPSVRRYICTLDRLLLQHQSNAVVVKPVVTNENRGISRQTMLQRVDAALSILGRRQHENAALREKSEISVVLDEMPRPIKLILKAVFTVTNVSRFADVTTVVT